MKAKTGSVARKALEEDERDVLALIEELDQDPFSYFMRYDPWKINRPFLKKLNLSREKCTLVCGGTPKKKTTRDDTPSVLKEKYSWKFERCMDQCVIEE